MSVLTHLQTALGPSYTIEEDTPEADLADLLLAIEDDDQDTIEDIVARFHPLAFPTEDMAAAQLANACVAWLRGNLTCDACGCQDIRQPHCVDVPVLIMTPHNPVNGERSNCFNCNTPPASAGEPDDQVSVHIKWNLRPRAKDMLRCHGEHSIPHMRWWSTVVCSDCIPLMVVPTSPISGWDWWDVADGFEFDDEATSDKPQPDYAQTARDLDEATAYDADQGED